MQKPIRENDRGADKKCLFLGENIRECPTSITSFLAIAQVTMWGAREQLWKHKEPRKQTFKPSSERVCGTPLLATLHNEYKCSLHVFCSD